MAKDLTRRDCPNDSPSRFGQQGGHHGKLSEALRLLIAGKYQSEVAKVMKVNRQTLNYHVKAWVKNAVLIEDNKGKIVSFRPGPNCPKNLSWGERTDKKVRLHSLGLKFRYVCPNDLGERLKGFDEVPLRHWMRYDGSIVGMKVQVTPNFIIIWASTFSDAVPEAALLRAFTACFNGAVCMSKKYGLEIDLWHAQLHGKKPHYAVADPVAEAVGDKLLFNAEVGEIDESRGFGEIDFHSLGDIDAYLKMPSMVREIGDNCNSLVQGSVTTHALLRANLGLLQADRKTAYESEQLREETITLRQKVEDLQKIVIHEESPRLAYGRPQIGAKVRTISLSDLLPINQGE